ncbi:hypothetical protein Trydic_g13162 [Trypoxylus dichotomus]
MYHLEILSVLTIFAISNANDLPTVEISNGIVQGMLQKSYKGRTFSSFEGIPYAKPPLGDLRFEPAQEPYNWTGVWVADTQHICLQIMYDSNAAFGTEDCLYINVYVPRATPSASDNMNVIVHIHGGAFMFGSGHFYAGPKYLMDEEVVFVTMNYRLGALGFLSTNDEVVPGNNGMKDQVLALTWIQKNIRYFGGNPDSVTITGMSAGGGSVHLHYFSHLSRGLFHRGMSQSGTAVDPWILQELIPERTKSLAEILGCPKDNTRDMVSCLKSRSGTQITEALKRFFVLDGYPITIFGPIVEKEHSDKAFLSENPYKMLKDGTVLDVPWIVSITAEEGDFMVRGFTKDITQYVKDFEKTAPCLLEFKDDLPNKDYVIAQIKEKYFKKSQDFQNMVKLISDRYFAAGAGQAARFQAKVNKSPVYFYIFGYKGASSFLEYFVSDASGIGATHGDDALYYLNSAISKDPLSPDDDKMKNIYLQLLTSYANNENPKVDDVTWNTVSGKEAIEYLNVKGPYDIYSATIRDRDNGKQWSLVRTENKLIQKRGMDAAMLKFKPTLAILILHFIRVVYGDEVSAPLIEISDGIPYARPPIGDLRFEPPKEPYNWTGTWIADTKHTCMYHTGSEIIGDEDCLYLNVYVPREKPSPSDNLNVFVHIHGGAFLVWDSTYYAGAKYLMDEEVVFVTMNYRLGAFGFLSTEDDVVPGNNGMKDQVLALEWIQRNIRYFGGNPESVTITGMSAGSVSVHLHYFSPLSRGLFHRGVSQSGTALDYWSIRKSPLKRAENLGKKLGCPIEISKDLRDCLRTRSAKEIVNSQQKFLSGNEREGPLFGPVIEKEYDGAFLIEEPYKLLEDGNVADVPWIVSTNEGEGSFAIHLSSFTVSEFFENFDIFAPYMFSYSDVDEETKQAITDEIKKHYSQGHGHLHEDIETLNEIFTDRMFLSGADKAAKLQAKVNKAPVYFYIFGYRGQNSFLDHLLPKTDHIGPTHGDDILYYLHTRIAAEKLSESDERMKSIFLQWLINYANMDEPKIEGIQWRPVSGDKIILEYLYFSPDGIYDEVAEGLGANALWDRLPLKEHEESDRIKDEL